MSDTAGFRRLEDAVLVLWDALTVEQVREMRRECPALLDFCAHLHHAIEHEQAMVRTNTWVQP